jgi:hypothetical protein
VTLEAERPHIREIALAAAFCYRHEMIRIPKRFALLPGRAAFR